MPDPDRLAAALAGRYRVERELGAGGMATVYLAQDLKHDRKVALKVLKPELAAVLGAERFVVEIKTTASLQHPHILPLFDSGTADGFLFYVMPFIEGETLRDKLNRETQLGVDEAVRIAREVADALDYAHGKGVIHRDIKPENILIQNGRPMVADFGIALAVSAAAGGRMTETGLSLGTPHYMSPEQATADREITGRSDIYSLASVLYEMLAGVPPHEGGSAQQTIMRIITDVPRPVGELRKSVPPNVTAALAQALEKLPADRFGSAAAFAAALANPSFTTTGTAVPASRQRGANAWLRDRRTVATLALAAASIVAALTWRGVEPSAPDSRDVMRFTIDLDSTLRGITINEDSHGMPAVSPDGRTVAFSGRTNDADLLIVRRLDQFEPRVVPGGGRRPFFSPDGQWVAFVRGGEIWRVRVDGGDPVPIGRFAADSWYLTGACWLPGRIVATTFSGVWILSENGGESTHLGSPDSTASEVFENPVPLDDDRVMVTVRQATRSPQVAVVSLRTGERRVLPEPVVPPAFVAEGMIVFGHDPVRAARFDARALTLIGAPIPVPDVTRSMSVSAAGSVAWFDDVSQLHELVWVLPDRSENALAVPPGRYRWPRLSPNGTQLVHGIRGAEPRYWLWTTDLRTGKRVRLGKQIGHTEPVWTPGGTHVIFAGGEPPNAGLLMQAADASQPPEVLNPGLSRGAWPTDVSRDGATLAFYGAPAGDDGLAEDDLHFLTLSDRSIRSQKRPGTQRGGRFSPDGKWFAYENREAGNQEVHVQPWPALDATWVVSTGGGTEPMWSRDGRILFYRNGARIMAVAVLGGASFGAAPSREVLRGDWYSDLYGDQSWDVAADGRFLMMRLASGSRVQVKVIRNWMTEFRTASGSSGNPAGNR